MTNEQLEQLNQTTATASQTADALTAICAALCKQPGIDGQRLRMDFLDSLEGMAQTPQDVQMVGRTIASLMESMLQLRAAEEAAERGKPRPS